MKPAKVINKEDHNYPVELDVTEGSVDFSHLSITRSGWPNLTLKLKGCGDEFWVRGEHRIDVGERVRLHHKQNSSPYVAHAYEIVKGDDVIFRYSDQLSEFVDRDSKE